MNTVLDKPKLLVVGDSCDSAEEVCSVFSESHDIVAVQNPIRALAMLARSRFDGVFVTAKYFQQAFEIGKLLQNEQILEGMPDGVVLLDSDNTIIWGNGRLRRMERPREGGRAELLRGPGQPGNSGSRLLPLPHGAWPPAGQAARRSAVRR